MAIGLSQIFRMVVTFAQTIILARLLVPADFGLVATITPITAFIGLFQNIGLQQAIIQRPSVTREHLNQMFWITMLVGTVVVLAMVAIAPFAAQFYGDKRITMIVILGALPLLVASLGSVPITLLNRNLRFGQIALNDALVAGSGLVFSVLAAWAHWGYWSLVVGWVGSAVVGFVAAWLASPWMPGRPTLRIQSELLSFGANLTGFNFVNFFARNLDNILLGRFSGMDQLGYYDRGYKLLLFPLQNISRPLTRLMVPLLSRIQEDKARFKSVYLQTNWALGLFVMPGVAAMTMTSDEVVKIFFGPHWAPVAPIFAWLGVASFAEIVLTSNGWIFICQGRTKEMFRNGLVNSGITIASFVVGLHWGAVGLAAAYAISGYVLRIPLVIWALHRIGPIKAWELSSILVVLGVAAGLSWALVPMLRAIAVPNPALFTFSGAVVVNYLLAGLCVFVFPPSRTELLKAFAIARRTALERFNRKQIKASG